jgi:hypothetical protein
MRVRAEETPLTPEFVLTFWKKKENQTGIVEQKQLKKETALTPEFLFT